VVNAPCRLHVYLAQAAPLAVVLRRGPSRWARLSLWHTDSDTFEHGQWIHARVYERRSDVSADGKLFIAFIGTSAASRRIQQADSWIAISRPPYFTALALWWIGSTWCTGGLFPAPGQVWVPSQTDADQGGVPKSLRRVDVPPHWDRTNNWTDRTVFHNRLLRDGWQRIEDARPEQWERANPRTDHTLVFQELGWDARVYGGPSVVRYALRDAAGVEHALERVNWADWDQAGRLVAAQDGRIVHPSIAGAWPVIADLNDETPRNMAPPDWALRWPKA
jgi:hypothetical protein